MAFIGTVKNLQGQGIKDATVDIVSVNAIAHPTTYAHIHLPWQWQADGDGVYDIQYPDREEPNDRGKILANPDGTFSYRGILPTAYPIVCCLSPSFHLNLTDVCLFRSQVTALLGTFCMR